MRVVCSHVATLVFLALACALTAQPERDPEDALAQARDKVLDRTGHLPNYTCIQRVDRTYLKPAKPSVPVPSCDLLSAQRTKNANAMMVEATDRLRLDVKVSAGNEIFSWAGDSHFSDGDIGGLAKGPFGTGPFGTFLSDIFTIPNVSFRFLGEEPARRKAQFLKYSFQVPRESSHYMVQAGGGWRVAGYEGEIQIDPNSFELRRLVVRTSELPEEADACEATTAVEYATIRIGTGDFLLPRQSTLHFLMRDATESEISATYSGCRQFVGEAKLVLQAGETARKRPPARGAPISIPAGLPIMLALEEPIDSDTAAAGDTVAAQVTSAVRENASRTVIIPAGSKVQCRVVRMEHRLD